MVTGLNCTVGRCSDKLPKWVVLRRANRAALAPEGRHRVQRTPRFSTESCRKSGRVLPHEIPAACLFWRWAYPIGDSLGIASMTQVESGCQCRVPTEYFDQSNGSF